MEPFYWRDNGWILFMTTPHSGGVVSIGFAGILSLSEFSLRECLAQTAAQNRIKFAHNVSQSCLHAGKEFCIIWINIRAVRLKKAIKSAP